MLKLKVSGQWINLENAVIDEDEKVQAEDVKVIDYVYSDGEEMINHELTEYIKSLKHFEDIELWSNIVEFIQDNGENVFLAILEACNGLQNDLQDIVQKYIINEYFTFYENYKLEDLAQDFVEEVLDKSTEWLANYIDYEKLAQDLETDGYIQTHYGVIYLE